MSGIEISRETAVWMIYGGLGIAGYCIGLELAMFLVKRISRLQRIYDRFHK